MGHSPVFCFLPFALFLFVCVSASAVAGSEEGEGTAVKLEQAKQAVEDAKTATKRACDNAQNNNAKAKGLLLNVEELKKQVEKAKSNAHETAQDNTDANVIIEAIKTIDDSVSALHQDAKKKLDETIDSLGKWLSAAQKLERECNEEISANEGSTDNYSTANTKALSVKSNAEALDKNITETLTIINEVQSIAEALEQNAKEAQVKNFHVNVIVAVAKIDAMIGKADGILTNTQTQRDAVNGIVQNMQKHCRNDLVDSYKIIKEQCNSADGELTKAKAAVEEAQNAVAAIKQQKGLADSALENVQKKEKDVTNAELEANKAKTCVITAEENVEQLNTALQTAETSLTNVKASQQKVLKALSTTSTSAPTSEEVKETEKSDHPVQGGTNPDQNDTAKQSTTTNTEQPTSKDSLNQGDNSADKPKDALSKGAQNVRTTALIGGKAPAPGANNDSAMTVSVPLLVGLIASAVLQ